MDVTSTCVITFGAPCPGDETFGTAYDLLIPDHWRFEHRNDVVPHLPPGPVLRYVLESISLIKDAISQNVTQPIGYYVQVGNLCFIDWDGLLEQTDSSWLDDERDARLLIAGESLITDHFINPAPSTSGSTGYVPIVDQFAVAAAPAAP